MSKDNKSKEEKGDTGDGAYVGGNVNTGGGDFVGRDKVTKAEKGGVAIGGNVSGSNIVVGDNNVVDSSVTKQEEHIQNIFNMIDNRPDTGPVDKEDLKVLVKDIQEESTKGEGASETFISRQLRNIKRMAPDILDVVLSALSGPAAAFGVVAKKVADKMKAEAGSSGA